jgi:PDZ domain-containing protein
MSRRTVAGLLAAGFLVALMIFAAVPSVPYVTVSPGPTVNVLGEEQGKPIVQVEGHRTYPTRGQLRLTTVSVTNPDHHVSLVEAMAAWLRPDEAVLPYAAMYPTSSSTEQEHAESAAQMVNSQDSAVAAALGELGYHLHTYAEVTGVTPDGPSEGKLEPRDRIETVEGKKIDDVEGLLHAIDAAEPGDTLAIGVRREGRSVTAKIVTAAAPDDPSRAIVGILVGTGYDFPFKVSVTLDDTIGGPSAGLMFALSVYDTLTPGALTQGATIAGTGTIAPDGAVGPIGGIRQKIVGARDAGAELFFVPPANCDSAVLAPVDADEIRLVRAPSLASAVSSLEQYTRDPSADLPRCPS